jgi:hypothetical protein
MAFFGKQNRNYGGSLKNAVNVLAAQIYYINS